jgi:hypothetical protein
MRLLSALPHSHCAAIVNTQEILMPTAERATVFERPQLALEGTAGTPQATGYRQLQSLSIMPSVKGNVDVFTPQGYKFATIAAQGKEWTESKVSGQPTFTEIIYPLSSICGTTTPTTVGSSTKVWTFDIQQGAADTPATYTIEHGATALRGGSASYNLFTDFGMKFDRSKLSLDGTMIGQRYRDDKMRWLSTTGTPAGGTFTITFGGQTTSALTFDETAVDVQTALIALSNIAAGEATCYGGPLPAPIMIVFSGTLATAELATITTTDSLTGGTTPATVVGRLNTAATALALVPILPRQMTVKCADAQSGLAGASAMTRVLECGFSLGGRFGPIWALNAANDSWAAPVELLPQPKASIKMAADSNGMVLLNNMRAGTTKFFEFSAVGDATESGQTYLAKFQMALKIDSISDFSDADGLYAVEFGGQMAYDPTWTRAFQAVIQNLLTAL